MRGSGWKKKREKREKKRKKGVKGSKKKIKRHTLEIYLGEENSTQNFFLGEKKSNFSKNILP